MDCNTARMLDELRGFQDDELPPEDEAELEQHLQTCPECQANTRVERRIDNHIAKAMLAIPVPLGLKSKIFDQIATQRGAHYRRRIWQVTAAAAALILAVGLFTWQPRGKAKIDLNELVLNADRDIENPKEKVAAWLALQNISYHPPVPLDDRLLAFHGMTTLQGKQVPMLYYRSFERNVFAQVYILRDEDFDLSNLPETFSGSSVFGHQVKVFRDAERPTKLAYVILFTGDSLEPFKINFGSA